MVEIAVPDLGPHAPGQHRDPRRHQLRGRATGAARGDHRAGPRQRAVRRLGDPDAARAARSGRAADACPWPWSTLAAFSTFDPDNPKASRYLDEDLNRVWTHCQPRRSAPLGRARPGARDPTLDRERRLPARHPLDADLCAAARADRAHREGPSARRRDGLSRAASWPTPATPTARACAISAPLPIPTARVPRSWWNAGSTGRRAASRWRSPTCRQFLAALEVVARRDARAPRGRAGTPSRSGWSR